MFPIFGKRAVTEINDKKPFKLSYDICINLCTFLKIVVDPVHSSVECRETARQSKLYIQIEDGCDVPIASLGLQLA